MISICSLAPSLSRRVAEIRDDLKTCTDDVKRRELMAEYEIKHYLVSRMIEEARPIKRKRKVNK